MGVKRPYRRLMRERLQRTGHMLQSEDAILYESLVFVPVGGARGRGRPRMRFYDTLNADLQARGVIVPARNQPLFWQQVAYIAANRSEWQKIVSGRR